MQKEIKKNALELQDQAEYQKRYDALTKRFNTAKKNLADTEAEISRTGLARSSIRQFLATLGRQKDLVTKFDAVQFQSLVDFITVNSKDDIRVTFKNGRKSKPEIKYPKKASPTTKPEVTCFIRSAAIRSFFSSNFVFIRFRIYILSGMHTDSTLGL